MRKVSLWTFVTIILFLMLFATSALGSTEESNEIQKMLISPSTRDIGISVYNCPDSTADKIRQEIDQKLAKGETKDQIISEYLAKYGSDLLATPPKKGFSLGVWIVPPLLILLAGGIIYVYLKNGKKTAQRAKVKSPLPDEIREKIDKETLKYL